MSINDFLRRELGPNISQTNLQVQDNLLNTYDRYAYHFKLIMVGERDANDLNIDQRLAVPINRPISNPDSPQAGDPVRQIVVAQSGVTTGLNITGVEIQDSVSSNHRTRNTTTTELKIKISEPYGMQLVDQLYDASRQLGLRNWRLAPMFLELTFKCYNADGAIVDDPQVNIRKVWKIILIEFNATLTEVGSTYDITAATSNTQAFMDYYYLIPHSRNVSTAAAPQGGPRAPINGVRNRQTNQIEPDPTTFRIPSANTVGAFFNELGEQLTNFYVRERERDLNNPVSPLMIYKFAICDQLKDLPLPSGDLVGQRRASFARTDNGNDIIVSRGISITALLDDILASVAITSPELRAASNNAPATAWWIEEDPQQGGRIKIPKVECVIRNVGWDELLNDYIREFNFVVSLTVSTRPVPTRAWGRLLQNDTAAQLSRLRRIVSSGSLKKAYPYYYTGLNTEIVHLDLSFQNLHIIPLPLADTTAITVLDQARIEELQAQVNRLESEVETARRRAILDPGLIAGNAARQAALEQARRELGQLTATRPPGQPGANADPIPPPRLVFFEDRDVPPTLSPFSRDVNELLIRDARQAQAQANAQNINTRLFVEDFNSVFTADPSRYTYAADIRDMANRMSRATVPPEQERGRQLYSSILTQIYDRVGGQLTEIEMTIRGDPYWLGKTNLERSVELDGFIRNSVVTGTETSRFTSSNQDGRYANYYDHDAHFLLLFRSGQPPNVATGFQDLNLGQTTGNTTSGSVFFAASYQTIQVTHIFEAGKFTQKLNAIRDNLINLNALRGENVPLPAEQPPAPTPPNAPASAPRGPTDPTVPIGDPTYFANPPPNTPIFTGVGRRPRPVLPPTGD